MRYKYAEKIEDCEDGKVVVTWHEKTSRLQNAKYIFHYEVINISDLNIDGEVLFDTDNVECLFDEQVLGLKPLAHPDLICSTKQFKRKTIEMMRRERIINKVIARLGNPNIIIESPDTDPDTYWERNVFTTKTTLREIIEDEYDSTVRSWREARFEIMKLASIKEVEQYIADNACEPIIFFGTEEDWNKSKQEKRRKELESAAGEIASMHGVKTNSLAFIGVVDKIVDDISYQQERWNDPEIRAEQWGASTNSETYFDDLNFENGRYHSRLDVLTEILDWVSENCPLLWAQYQEQKFAQQ